MTERQSKMFKLFRKLPLKEVTLLVDDATLWQPLSPRNIQNYQQYRWTMKQKQDFSKDVRDALLAGGDTKE